MFGTTAAIAMVLFYSLEERSPVYTLAFAASCAAAAGEDPCADFCSLPTEEVQERATMIRAEFLPQVVAKATIPGGPGVGVSVFVRCVLPIGVGADGC